MSRLKTRVESAHPGLDAAEIAARLLLRVFTDLSRYLGNDGGHALMTRAFFSARSGNPVLQNITIAAHSELTLHGVPESIHAHGVPTTAAGLEATVVALIDLLKRLIGDELVMKLLEHDPADEVQSGQSGDSQ